ncbi:MAG: hypothetical protein QOC55_1873 [Thermoleophilaceae bacterium]|nr:hypothetical protein [Thermoleophilaceae bacterium]
MSAATTRLGVAVALAAAGFGLGLLVAPHGHDVRRAVRTIAVRPVVHAPAEGAVVPALVRGTHPAPAPQPNPQPAPYVPPTPTPASPAVPSGRANPNTRTTRTGTGSNPDPFTPLTDAKTNGTAAP